MSNEMTAKTVTVLKKIADREQAAIAESIKKLAEAWNGSRVGTRTTTTT